MTLRSKYVAELAILEAELARIRLDLAENDRVDLFNIMARLIALTKGINEVRDQLAEISAKALNDVLNEERFP